MKRKVIISSLIAIVLVGLIGGTVGCRTLAATSLPPQERFRVATTTSLYDSGFWSYLEPMFEKQYHVELDIIYAGTGRALEYGRRGDVDIIVVHDKAREEQFIAEGYGVARVPFAYNYFLIVGPASDPAGIRGMSPEAAFKKLTETGAGSFVSRGDDSGTHKKEQLIWKQAGFDYEMVRKAGPWYIEAGIGMGPALIMAGEKKAYTLSDRASFLSYKAKIDLAPIVDKGDILLNVYSAIAINPERHKKTKIEMANSMISFLTSPKIQELIGNYGVKEYGSQLFIPWAGTEPK